MNDIKNKKRKYAFLEYQPEWVDEFEELKVFLQGVFGESALSIEHIGSTSIPGMAAKPVIDVLVTVEDIAGLSEDHKAAMGRSGYVGAAEYIAPHTYIFWKEDEQGAKTCNIHICEKGAPKEKQFIAKRDYFRAHPEIAQEYSDLKRQNNQKFPNDYPAYREAKAPFLQEIEQEAYTWWENRG